MPLGLKGTTGYESSKCRSYVWYVLWKQVLNSFDRQRRQWWLSNLLISCYSVRLKDQPTTQAITSFKVQTKLQCQYYTLDLRALTYLNVITSTFKYDPDISIIQHPVYKTQVVSQTQLGLWNVRQHVDRWTWVMALSLKLKTDGIKRCRPFLWEWLRVPTKWQNCEKSLGQKTQISHWHWYKCAHV